MRKKLSVVLMAAVVGISSLCCPASVFARNPTIQNGVGSDNFSIETTYSEGLDVGSLDVYRIYYYLLDDGGQLAHIDIDATDSKLSARVAPGDYQVARIKYIGSSRALKKEQVATKTFFRVYNDEVTTIPIAIGDEAIAALTDEIGIGNLYKEVDVNSSVENTLNNNDVTLNSPYVDESVFGDDDVREAYLTELTESGYLNEYGVLTSSGKELQEVLKEKGMKYEKARQEAIAEGVSLEEYLGMTDSADGASTSAEGAAETTQEEASSSDAEETRFDEEEQQDTKAASVKNRVVSTIISICVLGVVVFGFYIYMKKRY